MYLPFGNYCLINTMVDIYLSVHGERIRLLSIPLRDIQRLSIRPFKWLRFVMFCICGAKGQLSAMPDGLPAADYTLAQDAPQLKS